MRCYVHIDDKEVPIQDGGVPYSEGSHLVLFYCDGEGESQCGLDVRMRSRPQINGLLEPYGLRVQEMEAPEHVVSCWIPTSTYEVHRVNAQGDNVIERISVLKASVEA